MQTSQLSIICFLNAFCVLLSLTHVILARVGVSQQRKHSSIISILLLDTHLCDGTMWGLYD